MIQESVECYYSGPIRMTKITLFVEIHIYHTDSTALQFAYIYQLVNSNPSFVRRKKSLLIETRNGGRHGIILWPHMTRIM